MIHRIEVALAILAALAAVQAGCVRDPLLTKDLDKAVELEQAASATSTLVGQPAPEFTLPDHDSQTIQLSDLGGQWVVLYFFPASEIPDCGSCKGGPYLKVLLNMMELNAVFYGVTTMSVQNLNAFIHNNELKIRLLSDRNHEVMARYGVWTDPPPGESGPGLVKHATVIIGPDSVVRYHWPAVAPYGHPDRVRKKVAELRAQAKVVQAGATAIAPAGAVPTR